MNKYLWQARHKFYFIITLKNTLYMKHVCENRSLEFHKPIVLFCREKINVNPGL